jgi:hypothetical protein
LHENTSFSYNSIEDAIEEAGEECHLEIVKWLYENRTEGCTTQVMFWSVMIGYLNTIKWFNKITGWIL